MSTKVLGPCEPRLPVRALAVLHGLDVGRSSTFASPRASTGCPETILAKLERTAREDAKSCRTPLLMFLLFIAITLGITYWAARRSSGASAYFAAGRRITGWQNGLAVAGDYMSAASFLGIAGIIAFSGLRRLHVLGRLAGGVPHRALRRRRAAAQRRQVHHGRRARLPAAPAARARHGVAQHAHRQHVLHDRADGRRRRAGEPAAQGLRHRASTTAVDRRRRADDRLRRLRRHAGDHLGADHQGDAADGRHDPAQHSGAGALRLQLRRLLRRRRARDLPRQRRRGDARTSCSPACATSRPTARSI